MENISEMTWATHPSEVILPVELAKQNFSTTIFTFGSTVSTQGVIKKLTRMPYRKFILLPLLYAKKHRAWDFLSFGDEDRDEVLAFFGRMSVRQVQEFQGKQLQARKKQGIKYGIDNSRLP